MQDSTIRRICAAALAMAIGATPVAALAGQDDERPLYSTAKKAPWGEARSIAVSYADLNLLHAEGVSRLNTRVKNAAEAVCDTGSNTELIFMMLERRCFTGAMDRAGLDIAAAVTRARNGDQLASNAQSGMIRLTRR